MRCWQRATLPAAIWVWDCSRFAYREPFARALQRRENTAVIVLEVESDGPAHKAGVLIGDILIAVDGKPVMRLEDVHAHLSGEQIGKPVNAEFLRGGVRRETSIVVGERPSGGN